MSLERLLVRAQLRAYAYAASAAEDAGRVSRFVKGSTGGPDTNARTKSSSCIVDEAHDATGSRISEVHLTGINVYDFTAGILAWGAHRAAAGAVQGTGAPGLVEKRQVTSHAEAKQILRRAGYLQERIDHVLRHLPDPVDTERDGEAVFKLGVPRDTLMDRMGGSP